MNWSPQHSAVFAMAGMLLGVASWIFVAVRRSPYLLWHQNVLFFLNLFFTRVLWRTQVYGEINLDRNQGAVIIANHRSSIDPWFIQLVAGRVVHWFVAKEYFSLPVVGGFLRLMQTIPTRRVGVDTAATRQAIRYASKGEFVGLLPEGRINRHDSILLPGRPGAAMVAIKSKVPIVPCYIDGAPYDGTFWGCLFMPARVRLIVGKPIELARFRGESSSDADDSKAITLLMLREIAKLAGQHDFEPQVAGRRWMPAAHSA